MDMWKLKELDWANEVRYLCQLRKVKYTELSDWVGVNYRSLLRMLKRGIDNHTRDYWVWTVNEIAESRG